MSDRLETYQFINDTHGDAPDALATEDIMSHSALVTDTAGRKLFASIVRHHDNPSEMMTADFPQLRVTMNSAVYDNPTVQFHPVKGSVALDFWILFYEGDTVIHERQRERFVRHWLKSLSDPGSPYDPLTTSVVYSQPRPDVAGFGFHPRYVVWDFASPQSIRADHTATPPFKLSTGVKATRVQIGIEFTNTNEVFS